MTKNADCDVAAMRQLTVGELKTLFTEVFAEPPRTRHKEHLVRRIAWRLQAQRDGDLSERARRRAAELAREADLRFGAPRKAKAKAVIPTPTQFAAADKRLPMPGTIYPVQPRLKGRLGFREALSLQCMIP